MTKAANATKQMLKAMRVRCFIFPRYPRPHLPSTNFREVGCVRLATKEGRERPRPDRLRQSKTESLMR
jgi:hypothetical protein